jgi:diguanylate cyclase (GGDEF)-like protein
MERKDRSLKQQAMKGRLLAPKGERGQISSRRCEFSLQKRAEMKISEPPKTAPAARVKAAAGKRAVDKSAAASPIDRLTIAGIPDTELTPRVRQALISLMEEVQALRAELALARSKVSELEKIADSDPHLEVLNRRAFVRELNRALAMVERYGAASSLVFVDLNDLKKINDKWGHAAGDLALDRVAKILAANIRQTDAVGRLGGDEFGIILAQTDQATARTKADMLAELVAADPLDWKGEKFTARISCGVVEISKGSTADQALERADDAMYAVKKSR